MHAQCLFFFFPLIVFDIHSSSRAHINDNCHSSMCELFSSTNAFSSLSLPLTFSQTRFDILNKQQWIWSFNEDEREEKQLREKFPDRGKSNEKLRIEKKKKIIIIEREKRTSLPFSRHSLSLSLCAHVLLSCFLLNDTNIGRQSSLSTTSPNTVQEISSKSPTVWSSQKRTRRPSHLSVSWGWWRLFVVNRITSSVSLFTRLASCSKGLMEWMECFHALCSFNPRVSSLMFAPAVQLNSF